MRLVGIAFAIVCAIALSGATCSQRDGVVVLPPDKPRLVAPDSQLTADCAWPIAVKAAELTQAQVEDLIGTNADNQIECWRRHHALVKFYRNRDAGLTGTASTTR